MKKVSSLLYVVAAFFVMIPICIVLVTDKPFTSFQSEMFTLGALLSIIIGKLVTVIDKRRNNEKLAKDIGILLGLVIVLIAHYH